jgi:hypothetical protein
MRCLGGRPVDQVRRRAGSSTSCPLRPVTRVPSVWGAEQWLQLGARRRRVAEIGRRLV